MAEAVEQPPHVFALVCAAHLLIVAIVAFSGWLKAWRRPLPELLHVSLVTLPGPAQPAPEPAAAEPVTPATPPTPAAPPTPAPIEVTAPPRPGPVVTTPPRNAWKPSTVEEIRNRATAQAEATDPGAARIDIDADKLADLLRTRAASYGVPKIVTSSNRAAGPSSAPYFDAISAYLDKLWQQPNRTEIGTRRPGATVQLTVQANGRVSRARRLGRTSG